MKNKLLYLRGALLVIPAALTPLAALLSAKADLGWRVVAAALIGGIITSCLNLGAFISTAFADSPLSRPEGRQE